MFWNFIVRSRRVVETVDGSTSGDDTPRSVFCFERSRSVVSCSGFSPFPRFENTKVRFCTDTRYVLRANFFQIGFRNLLNTLITRLDNFVRLINAKMRERERERERYLSNYMYIYVLRRNFCRIATQFFRRYSLLIVYRMESITKFL